MASTAHLKLVTADDRAGGRLVGIAAAYSDTERVLLARALAWAVQHAGERRLAGDETLSDHALATVEILHRFEPDAECLAASLLSRTAEDHDALPAIRENFGTRIAELAEGAARMGSLEELGSRVERNRAAGAQLETLRKMLLAMAQDVRVVLIKLAGHTQTMRFAVKCDDAQLRHDMARLTRDIFAPLANRLGVWQLKWELEDLALRILEPDTYKRIAKLLDEKRGDRERYIESAIARLRAEFARANLAAEISGRPKHIFSIYNKMRNKAVAFDALYDVRALRVIVNDIDECYAALDIVHRLWTPLPNEFDDYIARPKGNDYRSLHTAVVGDEG